MVWWKQNKLRLIQTNLRDTDANMEVDLLIDQLQHLSANALQFNTAGLMAFYPTELEYHYKNPYLQKDLIREVIEQCHRNDIKFIARFDFSKAHKSIFEKKPQWFYRSIKGAYIDYNDMVHTCLNGYFQNEYSLEIIKEVLTSYPVDGIFFNMFGYQTSDYSGNYYGICHCDNCKKRFMELYHSELPSVENTEDPVYKKYIEFKAVTTRELLEKIHRVVKGISKDLPISTYAAYQVDMIRKESNTAVDRPYPIWLYSASENVKSVEDTWEDKIVSNCSINAVDIPYRFMGVSQHLIRLRLYQNIANGSGLDFCINGVFDDYPDRDNFKAVKEVFDFHKRNEQYYGCFRSVSDVALIKPGEKDLAEVAEEYLGIFKMLKEQHILFDVICQENLEKRMDHFKQYRCVIIPDYRILSDEKIAAAMQDSPVNWILTGRYPEENSSNIYHMIGGSFVGKTGDTRSAYLLVGDKELFQRFPDRDWVFIDEFFTHIKYEENILGLLPYINPARFGPPERCGGYAVSDSFGAGLKECGRAKIISVPWEIGRLYQKYGYEDHKNILMDLLDAITDKNYTLTTNAPLDTELFFHQYENGNYILQILNLSGYNGSTFYKPNPMYDITITINHMKPDCRAVFMESGEVADYENMGETLIVHIKRLDSFLAYIIS